MSDHSVLSNPMDYKFPWRGSEKRYTDKVNKVIIHCSAEPPGRTTSAKDIDQWHRERGWDCIGYHFVIKTDGTIEPARHILTVGAHTGGQNYNSIGVCMIGGLDKYRDPSFEWYTVAQWESLRNLLNSLVEYWKRYQVTLGVHGHNEFAAKDCPCFNVHDWWSRQVPVPVDASTPATIAGMTARDAKMWRAGYKAAIDEVMDNALELSRGLPGRSITPPK